MVPELMIRHYAAAFEQAAARVSKRVDLAHRESEEAATLLSDLLREPGPLRRQRIRSEPRLWLLKLCERLETASREAWAENPALAVELAQLAVDVGERLDVEKYGEALVEDARALAWAYLGNAWRIASDLDKAEQALARAEDLHRHFEIDLATEAEILGFRASLRNTQGRFQEAARLLDRAVQLYREIGDHHQEGRALILKGTVLGDGGAVHEAVHHLREGLARIDPETEPRLLLVAHHNLVLFLSDAGRNAEALAALEQSRPLYLRLGSRMDLLRLRWLEGRIALGLGRSAEAERALSLALEAFLELGIGLDAALVAFDLARVYARRGDCAAVKRIAADIVPVFQSCHVQPEALAALALFRDAAEAERITTGLLDHLSEFFRQVRRRPDSRSEG
jgi:tetratricopeptide (TPR) repeat protein